MIQRDFINPRQIKQQNIADWAHQSPYIFYCTLQICPASSAFLSLKQELSSHYKTFSNADQKTNKHIYCKALYLCHQLTTKVWNKTKIKANQSSQLSKQMGTTVFKSSKKEKLSNIQCHVSSHRQLKGRTANVRILSRKGAPD